MKGFPWLTGSFGWKVWWPSRAVILSGWRYWWSYCQSWEDSEGILHLSLIFFLTFNNYDDAVEPIAVSKTCNFFGLWGQQYSVYVFGAFVDSMFRFLSKRVSACSKQRLLPNKGADICLVFTHFDTLLMKLFGIQWNWVEFYLPLPRIIFIAVFFFWFH